MKRLAGSQLLKQRKLLNGWRQPCLTEISEVTMTSLTTTGDVLKLCASATEAMPMVS